MKITVKTKLPDKNYQEMRMMIFHPKTIALNMSGELLEMKLRDINDRLYEYTFDTVETVTISNLEEE